MLKIKSKLFFLSAFISMCASGAAQGEVLYPDKLEREISSKIQKYKHRVASAQENFDKNNAHLLDLKNKQLPMAKTERNIARVKSEIEHYEHLTTESKAKLTDLWKDLTILKVKLQQTELSGKRFKEAVAPFSGKSYDEMKGKCAQLIGAQQNAIKFFPGSLTEYTEYVSSFNQQLQNAAQALSKSGIDTSGKPIKFECKLPG